MAVIDSYSESNQSDAGNLGASYDTAIGQSFTGNGATLRMIPTFKRLVSVWKDEDLAELKEKDGYK